MCYPAEIIRGISSTSDDFVEYCEGKFFAKAGLFQFTDTLRKDGMLEMSINWYDDDGAITNILDCKKGDSLKYKGGAAIISRKRFVDSFSKHILVKAVGYERQKLPENKYHGNILVSKTRIKNLKGIISSTLASMVERIEKNDYK